MAELIRRIKGKVNLTYLNQNLAAWDFMKDEPGKTYEVMTWAPGRTVSDYREVQLYFRERGFGGNTAAFAVWLERHAPMGYHASIPEDDRLWRGSRSDDLYASYFYQDGACRDLGLFGVRDGWHGYWIFVAFREVPS